MLDPRRPTRRLAALALSVTLACACGGPLADARSEFDRGHYAAAKQALVDLGRAGRAGPTAERAQYALYCGLTHGALGDVGRARAWLREARSLADANPRALAKGDDERLRTALQTYDVGP